MQIYELRGLRQDPWNRVRNAVHDEGKHTYERSLSVGKIVIGNTEQVSADAPKVYMTTDISPQGLQAVYEALGAKPAGKVAVKLSTGENGSNYLRPD